MGEFAVCFAKLFLLQVIIVTLAKHIWKWRHISWNNFLHILTYLSVFSQNIGYFYPCKSVNNRNQQTTLTARSKIFCISILLHKNLLNRVISLYCRKNLPLFFFEYIGSSEILQIFEILFWYWVSFLVSFRFSKKSIFRFPLYWAKLPTFLLASVFYNELLWL